MKKVFYAITALLIILSLSGCNSKIEGEQGLIDRAREEINVADADTIDIEIAGVSEVDDNMLFWFVTGNEYQKHGYFPINFKCVGEDQYEFVRIYKAYDRAYEIYAVEWNNGYSFLINNENCQSIVLTNAIGETQTVEVSKLPFVYYYDELPEGGYSFLDANGEEL